MPRSSRILVTGGAGFIGSNLVRLLIQSGKRVINVDALTYAGNLSSLKDVEENELYSFMQADIADLDSVRSLFKKYQPDGVMHLAAESHVDRSIDGPGVFIQTNVIGTFNLLQSALEYYRELEKEAAEKFRFLHVSTDEVFGSLGDEGKFTEDTRYDPHSPYSASKASSDHLVRAWYDTYGLPTVVTNCSNNFGPYQFPEKLIPVAILKSLRGEPIPVYGKGENVRDWLYVEDHCTALLNVLENGKCGETYNIGGNNEYQNIQLIRMLCKVLDELRPRDDGSKYESLITFVKDRPGHDLRYAIDDSKIKRELGWAPKQDLESGLRATVKWYLENEAWWSAILSGDYRLERQGGHSV